MNDTKKVLMVCENEEIRANCAAMLKRVASALSAVDTFSDKMANLDEDHPDLDKHVAPLLDRLTLTLMEIYPNVRQFSADIKSIGDFTVKTI